MDEFEKRFTIVPTRCLDATCVDLVEWYGKAALWGLARTAVRGPPTIIVCRLDVTFVETFLRSVWYVVRREISVILLICRRDRACNTESLGVSFQ